MRYPVFVATKDIGLPAFGAVVAGLARCLWLIEIGLPTVADVRDIGPEFGLGSAGYRIY